VTKQLGEPLRCPTCQATDPVVGVEVRGVYDGVLFWECIEDGTRWHRHPQGSPYRGRAQKYLADS